MKVVILAGGFGTRLSEVTDLTPKPMVEIDLNHGMEPKMEINFLWEHIIM